jgi:ATP-dependent Clp protease ATP-binding subunit ClpC
MDDGRLTDSHGRTVDFSNTIIILTSNLGVDAKREPVGFVRSQSTDEANAQEKRIESSLKQTFRPEFLNRLDEIVVFEPLNEKEIADVANLEMKQIAARIGTQQIVLNISEKAMAILAKEGYDPQFGARPLKRLIERRIENILARAMLAGELDSGDTVDIDLDETENSSDFRFEITKNKSPISV